tara:strand:- start:108 stop:620 length:513 start_codon:yes stop_codon:yes gene_type:complete
VNVVENFLPKEKFNLLKDYFESDKVDWQFNSSTVKDKQDNEYLFSHIVSDDELNNNSNWKDLLELLQKHIGKFKVSRVKVNLYPNQNKQIQHAFHCDPMLDDGTVPKNWVTAILNLTTCNGYTLIGDDKIPSKENELIYFDANTLHCGVTQDDVQTRIVVNINVELINER